MTTGLLIAGHGSRDTAGVEEAHAFADAVRALRPDVPCELGFIELSSPPLHDAVGKLVAAGVDDVVVVPLVLLAAGHAKTDVPAAIQRERGEHPGVRFRYGAALGIHPDVLAIVEERIPADADGVLLVGRGSSDPDANGDLAKIARLLWEGRTDTLVEPAYVSITGPRVPEGLERLRRLGAQRTAVVPYFLFTGVLVDRIAEQVGDAATVTAHLGIDERLTRLVWQRFDETVAGDVVPNCDLCIYRTPMPGHSDRVGAAQTMHVHPDDDHTHHHADHDHA